MLFKLKTYWHAFNFRKVADYALKFNHVVGCYAVVWYIIIWLLDVFYELLINNSFCVTRIWGIRTIADRFWKIGIADSVYVRNFVKARKEQILKEIRLDGIKYSDLYECIELICCDFVYYRLYLAGLVSIDQTSAGRRKLHSSTLYALMGESSLETF